MNATAMNGRLNVLRCECVAQHDLVLPFHSLMFFQARIALLEGERRSFENIKVDLMRRIKMLEYALRVERSVPILLYSVKGPDAFPLEQLKATLTAQPSRIPVNSSHKSRLFAVYFPEGRDI